MNKFAVRMLSLLTCAILSTTCRPATYLLCGDRIVAILTTRFIVHLRGTSPDFHSLVFPGISSSRFPEPNVESVGLEGWSVAQYADGQNSS